MIQSVLLYAFEIFHNTDFSRLVGRELLLRREEKPRECVSRSQMKDLGRRSDQLPK